MLRQNEISSRPVIERDIDFADSTFRFDIPQDLTESESDQNEAEDDDQEGEEDAMAVNLDQGLSANVPELEDEGSGPEDFGSLSVSENETDQIEVPIDGDANLGAFLDDDIEEEYAQEEVAGDVAISRELEDQYRANEAIVQLQTRPMIQSKLALDDTAEILSEAEKEEEVLAPRPFPSKSTIRTISKPKSTVLQTRTRASKPVMMSKLGQKVPSLPVGVIKTLADSFLPHSGKSSKKTKKDTVAALVQATDWFFEQAAEDLDAYSKHADREIIEESDVVALMRRQRVLGTGAKSTQGNRGAAPGSSRATLFSLAQRFLPRELITELRMDPPPDERRKKRRKISEGGELI